MSDDVLTMSQWATKLGRNTRWLEQKTVQSIMSYAALHRAMIAEAPQDRQMIEAELGQSLQAQLDYAVYLTEHSTIGPDAAAG